MNKVLLFNLLLLTVLSLSLVSAQLYGSGSVEVGSNTSANSNTNVQAG